MSAALHLPAKACLEMRRDQTGLPQSGRRGYIRKLLPKPFLGGLYCILNTSEKRKCTPLYTLYKLIKEGIRGPGDEPAGGVAVGRSPGRDPRSCFLDELTKLD